MFHKYFWDTQDKEKFSSIYKLQRIIEYASFPDLIKYPFAEFKQYIYHLDIDKLWTGEKRKNFIKSLLPFIKNANNWDELFKQYINETFVIYL